MYSLPKISELIAENIEQLIAGMSVISQKPTRAEYDQTLIVTISDDLSSLASALARPRCTPG